MSNTNFLRPEIFCPKNIIPELVRLAKTRRNWVDIEPMPNGIEYKISVKLQTSISRILSNAADHLMLMAMSHWLADGPKVFRPTAEQMAVMEHVDVNLRMEDYEQPFPAIVVETPIPPFVATLCCKMDRLIVLYMKSADMLEDVTTTVYDRSGFEKDWVIDKSIQRYSPDCESLTAECLRCARIALNCCLMLCNYPHAVNPLFQHEHANDRGLVRRGGEAGKRAEARLALAPHVLSFSQEVRLHNTESRGSGEAVPATGREVATHWRRGHWAMQPHGPGRTERKRIFRKPVLVRSDLFTGDVADTSTTYRS